MDEIRQFIQQIQNDPGSIFNPEAVIRYGGITILCLTIFAETGLFFCFSSPVIHWCLLPECSLQPERFLITGALF